MNYKKIIKKAGVLAVAALAAVLFLPTGKDAGAVMEVQAAEHGEEVDYDYEGDFSYRVYEDGAVSVAYQGNDTDVTVPAVVGGRRVTDLEYWPENDRVTRITIPEGVKTINEYLLMCDKEVIEV